MVLTLGMTGTTSATADQPLDWTYQVTGLDEPVDIIVDEWGVPHIYAGEHYDTFFAQGFNAARDRLWQIDLWRKRGLGRLSEALGPEYVEQDRANRMFSYRGDMEQEWSSYGDDAKHIAESYTSGINAYVELARDNRDLLPWEFEFLGYEPDLWKPEDVVRLRTHAIAGNLTSEVERAYFVKDFGFQYEDIRSPLDAGWRTEVPEGLDLSVLPDTPDDLLRVYDLATGPVEFDADTLSVEFGEAEIDGRPVTAATVHEATENAAGRLPDDTEDDRKEGSNTFVVSPGRTTTEGPLIASDPHRDQGVPSLRYITHLNGPGIDVIGAGEPGLPGVSLGHNESIAFGLTIYDIDQEDLYVYETNPKNPNEYRYRGRWVPMDVETAEIPVRGSASETVEMKFTEHGPVIYEDEENNVAFGVRTVWSEPGTSAYFGSVEYMRAQDWDGFLGAMDRWGTPGENQQYADAEGNIGWKPAGRTPVRPNWDGLLPVPGDGSYEWDGFYDMDELPVSYNPERGWSQTNNETRLFDEHETGPLPEYVERKIGFEAAEPWRAIRTREVLAEMDDATIDSMLALQTDHLSVPGRLITAELDDITSADPAVDRALELLRDWDHVMDLDSAGAALFDVWTDIHGAPGTGDGFLGRSLLEAAVEDPAAVERIGEPDQRALVDMIENPEDWFTGDAISVRDEAITSSLAAAVAKLTADQGADPQGWRYGFYNKQELIHPLSELVDPHTRRAIDIEAEEREPVNNTVGDLGASWRYIAEPGDWDTAVAMNNPGQSGDPESPFYENLFVPWTKGETFPLLFDRADVIENAALSIRLEPAG